MERHPIALMDSSHLPASKQTMKTVIKDMWRREIAIADWPPSHRGVAPALGYAIGQSGHSP
jgi:hypothetical protein